jgi:hypothetical protein
MAMFHQTLEKEHFLEGGGAHPIPRRQAPDPPDIEVEDMEEGHIPIRHEGEGVFSQRANLGKGLVSKTFSGNDTSVSSAEEDTDDPHDFDQDEECIAIQIPLPGLVLNNAATVLTAASETNDETAVPSGSSSIATARTGTVRIVPGFCTICLSGFTVGSDIVWSSNRQCEHVFHTDCMEQWLTKQQRPGTEGPICPCCRRDFIVDPYDFVLSPQATDADDNESISPNTDNDDDDSASAVNNDVADPEAPANNNIHPTDDSTKSHSNPLNESTVEDNPTLQLLQGDGDAITEVINRGDDADESSNPLRGDDDDNVNEHPL